MCVYQFRHLGTAYNAPFIEQRSGDYSGIRQPCQQARTLFFRIAFRRTHSGHIAAREPRRRLI
jgi:hypothetical protein